jgi:AGZA family xanthine/uracil permease-like MFS transporter
MIYRVRGSILIGIFLTSIVSWPRPTPVTYFPYTEDGDALFNYFKKVVSFDRITMTGGVLTVSQSQNLIAPANL